MAKSTWEHIVRSNAFLTEKDEKKAKKHDDAPEKKAKDDADASTPAKRADKDTDDVKSNGFSDLKVERTPASIRTTALALAAVIGGPRYTPVGDTPNNILTYAIIHFAKSGHNPAVDVVVARALQFAEFLGIDYDTDVIPDSVRSILQGKSPIKEDASLVHASTYQTNPVLRAEVIRSIALWLTASGYVEAAERVSSTTNIGWSELGKAATAILTQADKIGTGRGRRHLKPALARYFDTTGILRDTNRNGDDTPEGDDTATGAATTAATTASKTAGKTSAAKKTAGKSSGKSGTKSTKKTGYGLYDYNTHERIGDATQAQVDANRDRHIIKMIAVNDKGDLVPLGSTGARRVYTKKD